MIRAFSTTTAATAHTHAGAAAAPAPRAFPDNRQFWNALQGAPGAPEVTSLVWDRDTVTLGTPGSRMALTNALVTTGAAALGPDNTLTVTVAGRPYRVIIHARQN